MTKIYVGDSVYAEFDGTHIALTTENGLTTDPSNTIFLDQNTMEALFNFVERIKREQTNK